MSNRNPGLEPTTDPRTNPRNGNGNNSPLIGLNESLSDLNLNNPNALGHFSRFLSAKNSVELHRKKSRALHPNRSLPCLFAPEDYRTLSRDQDLSGGGPSTSTAAVKPTRSHSQSAGKSVGWADLHFSQGQEILRQRQVSPSLDSLRMSSAEDAELITFSPQAPSEVSLTESDKKEPEAVKSTVSGGSESHTSIYLNLDPAPSPPLIPLLSRVPGYPFPPGEQQSAVAVDTFLESFAAAHRAAHTPRAPPKLKTKEYPFDTTGFPSSGISGYPLVPGLVPVQGIGQTPKGAQSIETLPRGTTEPVAHVNYSDGLNIPCKQPVLDEEAEMLTPNEPSVNVFGKMVEYNTISASDLHQQSPTNNGQYCTLPYNYYSNLNSAKSVPVYYEETQNQPAENQQSQIQYTAEDIHSYDNDDDLLEPEKAPELVMLGPRDIPTPDPHYVAQNVSPDLHPLIAKTCKKDCRTWLWKSARQRQARLAQQQLDLEEEEPSSALTSNFRRMNID